MITLCVPGSIGLQAQAPGQSGEYQLKAVFIFNFTQFVEWPASALPSDGSPFVIGILGENPFNNYLEQVISGEKINSHPIVIQRYTKIEDIKTCHILFINLADARKQEQVLAGLKERRILTISESNSFLQSGGMVRLFTKDNKIKFQVNIEATNAANLVVSSKLLRLADIFTPKGR